MGSASPRDSSPGGLRARASPPLRAASRLAGAIGLGLTAWACSGDRLPTSPPIETAAEFVAALRSAGADVAETAILPFAPPLVGGQVIFVGPERVEVFEAPTDADRRQDLDALLGQSWDGRTPALWSTGRITVMYRGTDGPTIALLSGLLGDQIALPGPATLEPYPPAVAAAIGWLAGQQGVDPGEIEVVEYSTVEWPNACLGLARTGEVCAMVVTFGWKVRLELDGLHYTLRTDSLGDVVRLEP